VLSAVSTTRSGGKISQPFSRCCIRRLSSISQPCFPWGGIYRGQEEAIRFFTTLVEHVESRVDIDDIIDAGEHIVAVGHSRGRVRASGNAFEVAVVHVWTMRQGKALRFENYLDIPTMLRALHGEPASTT
jgi:ketosteroid isomerase-like protein